MVAGLKGADVQYKRKVAVWSVVIAALLCLFVAVAGGALLGGEGGKGYLHAIR